jgi:hypothetical protein
MRLMELLEGNLNPILFEQAHSIFKLCKFPMDSGWKYTSSNRP